MTIAIDVDGVLADFVGAVCTRMGLSYPSINSDIRQHLENRLTEYESIVSEPSFPESIWRCTGADELIAEAKEYGDYVIPTTVIDVPGAEQDWMDGRLKWIEKVGLDPSKVVFMSPKQKTLLNVDMLIEDNEWTLTNWMEKQKKKSGLLVGRPWNSGKLTVKQCAKAVRYQRILRDG
jgi:5'(3')-deoxyribonucleotidase